MFHRQDTRNWKQIENMAELNQIPHLCDVLALGPVLAGHLESRQDSFLDVERLRRFVRTWAYVDNSTVDKWKVDFVTLQIFREVGKCVCVDAFD